MIEVHRGQEPQKLIDLRETKLAELRAIVAREKRDPRSDEIDGYRIVADDLWKRQYFKCCYCESRIFCRRNDVEHHRPKGEANRGEHHAATHGYWWLAFTWENLLFSCPDCNQPPGKGVRFPLEKGSTPLVAEQQPPGGEVCLLLDPGMECGVDFIEFRFVASEERWRPFARGGHLRGDTTIDVCWLNRDDLVKRYTAHVNENVRPEANKVKRALATGRIDAIAGVVEDAEQRLLVPSQEYAGLSYDALQHFVPDKDLAPFGQCWRRPA